MSARRKHRPGCTTSGECVPPRFSKNRPFLNIFPLFPTFGQFQLPTTGGHTGPPLRTNRKTSQKIETFWLTHCLLGGMAKAIPYKHLALSYYKAFSSKYRTLSRCFAVGADPCVRPAGTRAGFLSLGRMRTSPVFGKMGPFGKMLPLFPTFGPFKLPTTGGHLGPPLRTNGKASQKIETFWLTHCLPGGMAKAIPYKHLAPFHYKATSLQTSRTTLVLRRRVRPMCPPGRNTCRFP